MWINLEKNLKKNLFNIPIQYFMLTTVSNEEFLKDLKTHLKVQFDVEN